uniref:Uncharacterized protein n=1 Tax=Quercus lobata TaxID=97700 RepID=A0A7N2KMH4_QUELO
MGKTKDTQKDKDVKTDFRWSQLMQNLLLEILANEALNGNKQSNTFKHALYAKVVVAISEKFVTEYFSKGVGDISVEALDDSPPLVDANVDWG